MPARFRGLMKVLVLASCITSAGGIERYTATLLRALQDELGDQNTRCLAIPEVSGRGRHGRLPLGVKLRFFWRVLWETARWKPDLVICTHVALGPIGWVVAKLGGRSYWVVVHGIEAWVLLPWWKREPLRRADGVVITSAFSREQILKRQGVSPERILRLPCSLDETLSSLESGSGNRDQSLLAGRRVILTVARMARSERYKGHDVVLRALPSLVLQVPDLTYVIVGDGDDRMRLEGLAAGLGLQRSVVFTGEVSDAELAALYRRSEIFMLPARTVISDYDAKGEGFGIVFLEAMAFGKPVIGPNYGAPTELIRDGENGLLVDPEDASSVADALLNLLAYPEAARTMGNKGREWVRERFSYACFREQVREMIATPNGHEAVVQARSCES